MQLQLALVCDDAQVTPEGKLDIRGIFNDLYAPGFPAQHTMVLVLAVEWDRTDEGRYAFRVDLIEPDGNPALTVDGHSDIDRRTPDRPPARTRLVMPLENVIFTKAGSYSFQVTIKGTTFQGPSLHLMETDEPVSVPEA